MAYVPSGETWADLTVTWSIATSNIAGQAGGNFDSFITSQAVINQIATAISWWDNASGLTFQQVADSANADIRFGYGNVPGSATGRADYFFDQNNNFIPGTSVRFEDANPVLPLIAHEVGHNLGLDHITTEQAIMNPTVNNAWNSLFASDIEGITDLYGPNGGGNPGSIAINDVSITEGNNGTQNLVFTVTRSGGTGAFAVNYATANNTATAGSDYVATNGTLSFGANETSRTISVTINGDTAVESTENFRVNLSGATNGATIGDSQGTGTITNDDAAPPSDDFRDSFSDGTAPFGQVTVGGTATGNLEVGGDRDWFRVQLTAGATYQIDLQGAPSGHGTLADPYVYLYNGSGAYITENDDIASGQRNSRLSFTPTTTGTYYIEAREFEDNNAGTYRVAVTQTAAPGSTPGGIDDILWRHTDGTVATADQVIGQITSNSWRIASTGDFDGDGDTDFVWRHDQGQVVTWEIENGARVATHNIATGAGSWQIQDTGDFDGDGDDDILWHHPQGQVVLWEMENNEYVRTRSLPNSNGSWEVAATGDFDRDGDDDIVWQHPTGQAVIWEIENGAFVRTRSLPNAGGSWDIVGAGDFDRDGDADLLWEHQNGNLVIWQMQNGVYQATRNVATAGGSWSVQGVHDFDGDLDADVLWRHDTTGQVLTWTIQNNSFVQTNNVGTISSAWHIQGTGEFDL